MISELNNLTDKKYCAMYFFFFDKKFYEYQNIIKNTEIYIKKTKFYKTYSNCFYTYIYQNI